MTFGEWIDDLLLGNLSDWIRVATIPINSGRLAIADVYLLADSPYCASVPSGLYGVEARIIERQGKKWVARLRVLKEASASYAADRGGFIGVDHAQVAVCDWEEIVRALQALDASKSSALRKQLDSIELYGCVSIPGGNAILPVANTGGDGVYPVFDLVYQGVTAGLEAVFIGAECKFRDNLMITP